MIIKNKSDVLDVNQSLEKLRWTAAQIKEKCLQYKSLKDMHFYPDVLLVEQTINGIQDYDDLKLQSNHPMVQELLDLISKADDALTVIINKEIQHKQQDEEDKLLKETNILVTELKEIETEIEGLNTSISNEERELHQLEADCAELEEEISILQEKNSDAHLIKLLKFKEYSKGRFRHLQINEFLAQYKILVIDDSTTAFKFVNPPNTPEDIPILTLIIAFLKENGNVTFEVKASIESLDIEAEIQQFLQHYDSAGFIQLVYQKWIKHIPVLHEILQLRQRYAADWIAKQSMLKVMFGQAGQIICSLIIPEDYPNDQAVTLQKIDGLPVEDDIRKYQLPGNRTLTEWLDHLGNAFS